MKSFFINIQPILHASTLGIENGMALNSRRNQRIFYIAILNIQQTTVSTLQRAALISKTFSLTKTHLSALFNFLPHPYYIRTRLTRQITHATQSIFNAFTVTSWANSIFPSLQWNYIYEIPGHISRIPSFDLSYFMQVFC